MAVLRSAGMKAAPGKDAEFDEMWKNPSADMNSIEGLQFMASMQPAPGNMASSMIFASQAHVDSFKSNMRAKMMEKFKGVMGGQNYMVEGELVKKWSNGQKVTKGMALRNVSFRCKPGKEAAFAQMASGIYEQPAPAGLVFRAYMMTDARTMASFSVFDSMGSLDAYNAEVRAKYAAQMGEMMEGPVYDEKGVIVNAVGPKGDAGDSCCAACVIC